MHWYVLFYKDGREACGDRSVIQYDGRMAHWRVREDAAREQTRRGYDDFSIHRAANLRDIPTT